jgi:hypothetical protein
VPWYRVRFGLAVTTPPSPEQIDALESAGVLVWRRGDNLSTTVVTEAGDPAGATARAMNVVLDVVPGEVVSGEFELTGPPEGVTRRPVGRAGRRTDVGPRGR